MSLRSLIAISGIFGSKNEDLDILPPPPPFPDIVGSKKPEDAAEEEWKRGGEERKGKRFKLEKQEKNWIKKEARAKTPQIASGIDKNKIELTEFEQKKSFFGKLFEKKDEELEKGLEGLDEIMPEPRLTAEGFPEFKIPKAKGKIPIALEKAKPLQDISQAKFPKAEFEEDMGLDEMKKAEEEIRMAIDGMKGNNKSSVIGRLFRRKEKQSKAQISGVTESGKIETPEVMPRTFEKIDHVQEIEERVHKARMCLMDFKFDDAKRIYMEIMKLYSSISQKDRYKVYQDIRDLYYERKSAEKFAKVQY